MGPCRTHGAAPYRIAVIHGGPGAPGEAAPVARALSARRGVLEPLQTAASLEGQAAELSGVLAGRGLPPVTLIGHSWGAWLAWIVAARRGDLVGKLILVGSGSFEQRYAEGMLETRLSRLDAPERAEVEHLRRRLESPTAGDRGPLFARFGELLSKADNFDPLPCGGEEDAEPRAGDPAAGGCSSSPSGSAAPSLRAEGRAPGGDRLASQPEIFRSVWPQAAEWRRSGRLLELAERIRCPVVAIHGDHDPHPAAGVREPLAAALEDFRFVLLPRCGHKPWIERHARGEFFRLLEEELPGA